MEKETPPHPTDAELAILGVLWRDGPCTVRQVYERLKASRATGYTTALKLMQIMTEKGLVFRNESERTHVYRAGVSEQQTQRRLVRDLLERVFGGSAHKLVMQALQSKKSSPTELAEIRKLLGQSGKGLL